jgi:hypothetical protein
MKITGLMVTKMVATTVLAAAGASAAASLGERERVVVVCVHSGNEAGAAFSAKALASEVFAQIGVRIEWPPSIPCPSAASVIQISFSEPTREALMPGVLAYARPYEGTHIVVFSDRIKQMTRYAGAQQLLGYVMVHEITHILQGVKRHSATGLMKAQWSHEDYFQMGRKGLGFTPEDQDLIYRGVDARQAEQAGAPVIASR